MISLLREYGDLFIVPIMFASTGGMALLAIAKAISGDRNAAIKVLIGAYRLLIASFMCGYIAGMWH